MPSLSGRLVCVPTKNAGRVQAKLVFGRPIEDSSPLLPREEFRANMIVEPIEVS